MGYRLNRLDEPIFMAGPKPMRTEFGIHPRLESCVLLLFHTQNGVENLLLYGFASSGRGQYSSYQFLLKTIKH